MILLTFSNNYISQSMSGNTFDNCDTMHALINFIYTNKFTSIHGLYWLTTANNVHHLCCYEDLGTDRPMVATTAKNHTDF